MYQEALALELAARNVPYRHEVELPNSYKERKLSTHYQADFICYDAVIVEVKALDRGSGMEEAQVINYLKATGKEVGLLLNFGTKSLEYRRFVLSESGKSVQSVD